MKRFTIYPEVKTPPHDISQGPASFAVIAKAMIQEDDNGFWVHYHDAAAAIKQAADNVGGVTLRQRYKIAALTGMVSGNMRGTTDEFAHRAGELANSMLAEDEEHAKK